MNAELLLKHFERISDAPDDVARLRRFVLDLAVRGLLCLQDEAEQVAPEVQQLSSISLSPTEMPRNWRFCRLGDVLNLQYGEGLAKEARDENGRVQVFGSNGVVGYHNVALTEEPAIIIGRKGSAGALNLCEGPSWTTDVAYFVVPPRYYDIRFALIALRSLRLETLGKGVKPGLSRNDANVLQLPIPPLAEQRRIVKQVDHLLSLCDKLEAAQTEREKRRDRVVAASLKKLSDSASDEEIRNIVTFYLNHLPRLAGRAEHIDLLKRTILEVAIRGKLVPQNPLDEPASSVLERLNHERTRSSLKRGSREFPARLKAVERFALPQGWAWAAFPQLGTFGRGKSKHRPRNDSSLFENGTHLLVQTGDVARSGGVVRTFTNKYNEIGLAQSLKWPEGTLCITIAANIADSGILSFDACFPDSVVGFVPAPVFPNARYFEYFVRTAKARLLDFAPATAQKNINLEILSSVLIPLPPVAEMSRIVARLDELLGLCDELASAIDRAAEDRIRLLGAVLHAALSSDRPNEAA